MKRRNWTIGKSVVVKPDVTDPDTGRDIGGWQGRISAILDEAQILTIQWDSLTLKSMPPALLAWSEEEGLSWSEMNLSPRGSGACNGTRHRGRCGCDHRGA